MDTTVTARRTLDFSKLSFSGKFLSSEEALKDVVPMDWNDEVKNRAKKVSIFHSGITDNHKETGK